MKHLNWMAYHPLFGSVYGGLEICMEGKTVYGGCSLQSGHHLFCDHMRIAHVWHMVLLSMLIYCCMSSWPQEFLVTYDLFCYCMHGGIIMKYSLNDIADSVHKMSCSICITQLTNLVLLPCCKKVKGRRCSCSLKWWRQVFFLSVAITTTTCWHTRAHAEWKSWDQSALNKAHGNQNGLKAFPQQFLQKLVVRALIIKMRKGKNQMFQPSMPVLFVSKKVQREILLFFCLEDKLR